MATLQTLLASSDQSVRLKAALAAGTYPEPEFIEILVAQCAHEPDFFVRDTLTWALIRNDIPRVVEVLKPELKSDNVQSKSQAIHTFTKIGDQRNYALITHDLLFNKNEQVAMTAWRAASVLVPDKERENLARVLVTQLGRGDSDVQFGLTRSLCAIGEAIVIPLSEAAKSPNEEVRIHAEFTLMRFQEMMLENKKTS
jgi:HEAT repeat protein